MKINKIPKNIEFIHNKYIDKEIVYEFECWVQHFTDKTIFKAHDKSPSKLASKINKFFKNYDKKVSHN